MENNGGLDMDNTDFIHYQNALLAEYPTSTTSSTTSTTTIRLVF